jgi:1-acyl-sn-glycerol-3-phosphate acyltransferase
MNIYPIAAVRGCRVALHLIYGALQALCYPHLDRARQQRLLKKWSGQLLTILNIRVEIGGHQQPHAPDGCLMVSNHVSWLDIFVLNAIQPAHFIAKAEVRGWPLIGWLCARSGTIFVKRTLRRDAQQVNQQAAVLLRQGACVGLFPEGTTSDGSQVGHFHPALMQSAIDAETTLCPVALRYLDIEGRRATAAAFTGDTTLALSLWRILCCRQLNVSVAFTPPLPAATSNRRMLARMAHEAIVHSLHTEPSPFQPEAKPSATHPLFSTQSAYVLLLAPVINQLTR